ncbi:hypothetical protein [uncultured Dokdonia sp.]|uniref:hypothetical protein n=1 Tax=uncultured Dokdonia sp. TaxID=575653 RepID=UPI00262BB5B3|nr:hypothetical protein [uncultured Dokdonia sp.]
MEISNKIIQLEKTLRELSDYEKRGLDTSSLRIFIKNLKIFEKIQESRNLKSNKKISFEDKLELIKSFLEDKKVFPRIRDLIDFTNVEMGLGFKDQKESRALTIQRIIKRIEKRPELKDKVKLAVQKIRNETFHNQSIQLDKKELSKIESFTKWAEILSNL